MFDTRGSDAQGVGNGPDLNDASGVVPELHSVRNQPHAHLTMTDIQHVPFPANRANQARLLMSSRNF